LQGDRKVVIYSDANIEPASAFGGGGGKMFTHTNGSHHHNHTGKSFFGHASKENSKHFKFGHGLFGGGGGGGHNHSNGITNYPQHNHPPLIEVNGIAATDAHHGG